MIPDRNYVKISAAAEKRVGLLRRHIEKQREGARATMKGVAWGKSHETFSEFSVLGRFIKPNNVTILERRPLEH